MKLSQWWRLESEDYYITEEIGSLVDQRDANYDDAVKLWKSR